MRQTTGRAIERVNLAEQTMRLHTSGLWASLCSIHSAICMIGLGVVAMPKRKDPLEPDKPKRARPLNPVNPEELFESALEQYGNIAALLSEHVGEIAIVFRFKTSTGRPYSRVRGLACADHIAKGLVMCDPIETQDEAERRDKECQE